MYESNESLNVSFHAGHSRCRRTHLQTQSYEPTMLSGPVLRITQEITHIVSIPAIGSEDPLAREANRSREGMKEGRWRGGVRVRLAIVQQSV